MLDEFFKFSDSNSVKNASELLKEISSENIFLITHSEVFNSKELFDNVIVVSNNPEIGSTYD